MRSSNPQERVERGSRGSGRITLSAGHEGDRVAIRVEDDGRGLDREKIVRKGIALGMVPTGTPADDPRVVSLIFEPGFSTRDTVSELSGRGVGLDVVRDAVRALRGSVAVESTPGKGTAFIFRLPLTLALIDGLLVETAGGRYVVPLAQVEECVALDRHAGWRCRESGRASRSAASWCRWSRCERCFGVNGPLPARQELLLTRHAGQRVGVAVDRLVGRVQAVIQSLGEGLHGLNRFSGATILGDGSVSLILDLSALVSESRFAEQRSRSTPSGDRREGGEYPMRITLSWKITAILVLFGLVPASIVAWFAYNANDDFRKKQNVDRGQDGRSDQLPHVLWFMQQDPQDRRAGARRGAFRRLIGMQIEEMINSRSGAIRVSNRRRSTSSTPDRPSAGLEEANAGIRQQRRELDDRLSLPGISETSGGRQRAIPAARLVHRGRRSQAARRSSSAMRRVHLVGLPGAGRASPAASRW